MANDEFLYDFLSTAADKLVRLTHRLDRVRDHFLPSLQQLERMLTEKREKRRCLNDQLMRLHHDSTVSRLQLAGQLWDDDDDDDEKTTTVMPPPGKVIVSLTADLANLEEQMDRVSWLVNWHSWQASDQLQRISSQLYRSTKRLFKVAARRRLESRLGN